MGHPRPLRTRRDPDRALQARRLLSRGPVPVSFLHEAPRLLLEARPSLLFELLGTPVPEAAQVNMVSADLTQALPAERRADAVVTVVQGETTLAVYVVEVQLAVDPEKHFAWPLYAAAAHARHRCPTRVVVLTPHPEVATWARQSIGSFQPEHGFRPCVVGPGDVPIPSANDPAAQPSPDYAVMGALLHSRGPQVLEALAATMRVLARIDASSARRYAEVLHGALGPLTSELSTMAVSPETLKRYEEALEIARIRHTLARALRMVMETRGITLTDLGRLKLRDCEDPEIVERWLCRAATATTEAEIFAVDPPAS
jgi:hypothetical protein